MAQDLRGAYVGTGKIYLADLATPDKLLYVGMCSSLEFDAQTEIKELADSANPGGGLDNSITRVTGVEISYTGHYFNKTSLARALSGVAADVAGASVVDEVRIAYKGALAKTEFPNPSAVIVKHTTGMPVYVLGTDYTVNEAGIEIVEAGAITDAQSLKVSYTYPAHANIQGLVTSGKKYRMVFKGLNEARSGKPMIVEVYKMSHGTSKLAMIGDDFGDMPFTGKAEKDPSKTGALISPYLQVQDVD
jgi:hypothetical protein